MTDIEREAMGLWKWGVFLDRMKFLENAKLRSIKKILSAHLNFGQMLKLWFISKLSISILQKQISTATKITSNHPFRMRLAPVSLQYNNPFSKNISLASVLQLPFRTGSKHPKKWVAPYAGLGMRAGNVTKKYNR